jgi:hypothetical protein
MLLVCVCVLLLTIVIFSKTFERIDPESQCNFVVLNSSTFIILNHLEHYFSKVVLGAEISYFDVEANPASPKAIITFFVMSPDFFILLKNLS